MKKVIGIMAACMLLAGTAQAKSGDMGLTFGSGMNLTGKASAGVSYWLDDNSQINVDLAFDMVTGDAGTTVMGLGAGYKAYMNDGAARGFYAAGLGINNMNFDDIGGSMSLGLGGGLGVEYFFNDNLAVSAHTGLGVNFANNFEVITLGLYQTGVSAHIYW